MKSGARRGSTRNILVGQLGRSCKRVPAVGEIPAASPETTRFYIFPALATKEWALELIVAANLAMHRFKVDDTRPAFLAWFNIPRPFRSNPAREPDRR
jgi:hypothetical protein